jgi:U4/U6.U5 tri-snRNP-associated protein 1
MGLAGTLSILRSEGSLQGTTADQRERERIQRQQDEWLADQRARAALRELERAKARGGNQDQQQREYANRLREQQEARQATKAFENYKPDVNIVYHDEFGREMTPKEAWKALSHRFHGKGSGKMKTEKRLKKIAEEKKMQAMISGETPLGMTSAFQARQEKMGQAHMVLSVGNRG